MAFRLFLILIFLTLPAYAGEKAKSEKPLTKLEAASKKMLDGLDHNQTLQFAAIRNSHSVIRAVEDVEKTIEAASKSCSQKNPEFADSMQKRVGAWKSSVDPILTDARQRLNTMIKLQNYASASDARSYLKKVDEAVAYKSKGVEIIPITEKKECKKLLGTLDDTQEDMTKLIIETLGLNKPVLRSSEK